MMTFPTEWRNKSYVPNHQPVLIGFSPCPRNCLGSSKAAFTMDLAAASAASLEETSALTSLGRTKSLMEIWGIGPSTSYRVFHGFLGISEGGFPGISRGFPWFSWHFSGDSWRSFLSSLDISAATPTESN